MLGGVPHTNDYLLRPACSTFKIAHINLRLGSIKTVGIESS